MKLPEAEMVLAKRCYQQGYIDGYKYAVVPSLEITEEDIDKAWECSDTKRICEE